MQDDQGAWPLSSFDKVAPEEPKAKAHEAEAPKAAETKDKKPPAEKKPPKEKKPAATKEKKPAKKDDDAGEKKVSLTKMPSKQRQFAKGL